MSAERRARVLVAVDDNDDQRESVRAEASRIAWSRGEPVDLRLETIDFLAEHDEDRFAELARRKLVRERDWQVVMRVFDHAQQHDWPGFERVALRRLADPSSVYPDADRPELAWLRDTTGRPPQDIAFEVFGGWDPGATLTDRVAAWVALNRMVDHPTRDALLEYAMGSPAEELQAASEYIDVLPDTREQMIALLRLSEPSHADLWAAVEQANLTNEQRRGLALRHLPNLLLMSGQDNDPPSRDELVAELSEDLNHQPIARLESRALDPDYSEAFADHLPHLAYPDLLTLATAQAYTEMLIFQIALVFGIADLDFRDSSTEFGGLIIIESENQVTLKSYDPMLRGNDTRYIASDELIFDMPRALAHYHFHASSTRNPEHAGPGQGDLDFARRFGVNAVVFTLIDRDTLNVDFYMPDGTVIDLGVIRRP